MATTAGTADIDQKYLTFSLGEEEYGIPVAQVTGIVKVEELIEVPHSVAWFPGLMDVRGQIMPVVDLKLRLGLQRAAGEERGQRAIIVEIEGHRITLMVDAVYHVHRFSQESIDAGPPSIKDGSGQFMLGVGKRENSFVVLINVTRLFEGEELAHLSSAASELK
ncbi:MAG: purine-binding chemotaxis protein CheW [Leptospiraceae bacterium]|nr:purine-binding chemotaxis protein CheW [Leptospiraceae bacterium]